MDVKIKKLLEIVKTKYKLVIHRKVYTAFTEAETQHIDPKTVVKTVFVKLSKPIILFFEKETTQIIDTAFVAVPAGRRVDLKKIAKIMNDQALKSYKVLIKTLPNTKKPTVISIKMANEKDITNKLKTKVGLLSPFSQIYNLPLLFDKKLTKNKKLTLSAGSYTESLEINTKDFLKITPHLLGSFTE